MTANADVPVIDLNESTGPNKPVFCINVKIGRPGARRQIESTHEAVDIDGAMDLDLIHVSKTVFECDAFKDIRDHDAETRRLLRKRTAGQSYLRHGIHLVNALKVEATWSWLSARRAERRNLVSRFLDRQQPGVPSAYEQVQTQDLQRLGAKLFCPDDYPAATLLRKAFTFKFNLFSMPGVDALKELSPAVWRAESAKARVLWSEALNESRTLFRVEIQKYVDALVDRLTPEDGKKKKIGDKVVANISDFIAEFETREVSNDDDLRRVLAQMRDTLKNVDGKTLKKSENLRESVLAKMTDAKDLIGKLVQESTGRCYSFGDDDEDAPAVATESEPEAIPA